VLFRALRCGEPDEDTEVLNFTTKIAAEGVRIELGTNDSLDITSSTPDTRPRKRKSTGNDGSLCDEESILGVMNKVAESMTAGGSPELDYCTKRSRFGEHRKAETDRLMRLLSQKRELRESGLLSEDLEVMEELEI
jgi:hypothetical protein